MNNSTNPLLNTSVISTYDFAGILAEFDSESRNADFFINLILGEITIGTLIPLSIQHTMGNPKFKTKILLQWANNNGINLPPMQSNVENTNLKEQAEDTQDNQNSIYLDKTDEEYLPLYLDNTHSNFAPELKASIDAWLHLYSDSTKQPDSVSKRVKNFLEIKNIKYNSEEVINRISSVITPKSMKTKKGSIESIVFPQIKGEP